jgi:peptidoglycan/LPS O-acetylase OafA/YrhL
MSTSSTHARFELVPQVAGPAHLDQLDGLRALAVAAVLAHHYRQEFFHDAAAYAAFSGVRLFFALSGFLITGILIRARARFENGAGPRMGALKVFYIRRFLRIFPLYYFVVIVCYLVRIEPARRLIAWLLTYTLNIQMASQGWFEDYFAHFWSLSVEEQFYLFWPWIVLYLRSRFLPVLAVAMMLAAPLWRLAYILTGYKLSTGLGTYIGTIPCLDSLGAGAVLAIFFRSVNAPEERKWYIDRVLAPVSLTLFAAVWLAQFANLDRVYFVSHDTALSLVCAWIIGYAASGRSGIAGKALSWRPLAYIGQISYGVYVYHPFVPRLQTFFLAGIAGSLTTGYVGAVLATGLALGIASLSWFVLERPINGLKRRFPQA